MAFLILPSPTNGRTAGPLTAEKKNAPCTASALDQPEALLHFASQLSSQRDYFRAIGEYERFLFFYPSHLRCPEVALRIATLYAADREWSLCLEKTDDPLLTDHLLPDSLRMTRHLLRAYVFTQRNDSPVSLSELRLAAAASSRSSPSWSRLIALLTIWSQRHVSAASADSTIQSVSWSTRESQVLASFRVTLVRRASFVPKSRIVAGTMSAVLPGAGRAYYHRLGDALVSLVMVGGFLVAGVIAEQDGDHTAGRIGISMGSLLYLGNIYGSSQGAERHNYEALQVCEEQLRVQMNELLRSYDGLAFGLRARVGGAS